MLKLGENAFQAKQEELHNKARSRRGHKEEDVHGNNANNGGNPGIRGGGSKGRRGGWGT